MSYSSCCCCRLDIFEQQWTLILHFLCMIVGSVLAVASSSILLLCSCTTTGVSYCFSFLLTLTIHHEGGNNGPNGYPVPPLLPPAMLNATLSFSWPCRHKNVPTASNCPLLSSLDFDSLPFDFFFHSCLRGGKLQWKKQQPSPVSFHRPGCSWTRQFPSSTLYFSFHLDD